MYILVTYVPPSHLAVVQEALFAAGAGKIGSYDHCSFQSLGVGQFRPLAGSDPFSGSVNEVATVEEWRLELVVEKENAPAAVKALLASHPYEVPAYHLIEALTLENLEK
ncbi:MAG: NGG1p interacting factor NIF3 [Sphaerochaeta sp.]|nr:NGG1p interacting factor NIF3 [Spirochaetales bacterium]